MRRADGKPSRPWTDKDIAHAKKVIARHSTLVEAAAEIGRITAPGLTQVFRLRGLNASSFLRPVTPADRVVKLQERTELKELRAGLRDATEALAVEKERVACLTALASAPLPPVGRREIGSGVREATAEVLISDLHVETFVRPESTPLGNAYCLAIADLRLQRLFDAIEWQVGHATANHKWKVRDLVLWLGGDNITNHLHPENVETAQLGPTRALLWVQERLLRGIRQLLASRCDFERIDIICCSGNHGRTTKYMNSATATDHCWEWLMYTQIAELLRDEKRVKVHAPRSVHQYHRIYEWDAHYHHGHEVKYGGGIGGIMIPVNKATAAWDTWEKCHLHRYGHWHQYIAVGHGTRQVCINGSLIGADPYALTVKATPEPPTQAFNLIDSRRGIAMSAPLWVGDPAKEAKLWARSRLAKEAA